MSNNAHTFPRLSAGLPSLSGLGLLSEQSHFDDLLLATAAAAPGDRSVGRLSGLGHLLLPSRFDDLLLALS